MAIDRTSAVLDAHSRAVNLHLSGFITIHYQQGTPVRVEEMNVRTLK